MLPLPTRDDRPLLALRQDLRVMRGANDINGTPRWLIYDGARHRYFEIGAQLFELLSLWREGTRLRLASAAVKRFNRVVLDGEIDEAEYFLSANSLTEAPPDGDSRQYAQQAAARRRGALLSAVHSYLFMRMPLVRPQRFLTATAPVAAIFYSRVAFILTLIAGLAGLYLASRQWEAFASTFLYFFTLEGMLLYAVSLAVIKVLHELGHAYTAHRHGVRVPTMGVALMVLFPVLYTDVTDAWRLRSRRARLEITAAGVAVELMVACYATLAWSVLPDGPVRSAAFLLATSSWVLSLAVNLNPFMRFDGYYLLSDGWGIANLQPRSFAIGRWALREFLFGLGETCPERFERHTERLLALYAFGTWLYRLVLFIGIALIVYNFFFKAAGILLFFVEIIWFIGLPVGREIGVWWTKRDRIMKTKRTLITALAAAAGLALLFVPWGASITVPATLEARTASEIFAPQPGQVDEVLVSNGQPVTKGQTLFRLRSPELSQRLLLSRRRLSLIQARINRQAGGSRALGELLVLKQQFAAESAEATAIAEELGRLEIKAPSDGIVRDLPRGLSPGRWVARPTGLGRIVDLNGVRGSGLIDEALLWRTAPGARGRFIPDDPSRAALDVELVDIATSGADRIDSPYLASRYGGPVAVEETAKGELRPRGGQHVARFTADGTPSDMTTTLRGLIHLEAEPESLAAGIWRQVMRVLVREAGL